MRGTRMLPWWCNGHSAEMWMPNADTVLILAGGRSHKTSPWSFLSMWINFHSWTGGNPRLVRFVALENLFDCVIPGCTSQIHDVSGGCCLAKLNWSLPVMTPNISQRWLWKWLLVQHIHNRMGDFFVGFNHDLVFWHFWRVCNYEKGGTTPRG